MTRASRTFQKQLIQKQRGSQQLVQSEGTVQRKILARVDRQSEGVDSLGIRPEGKVASEKFFFEWRRADQDAIDGVDIDTQWESEQA